MNICSSVCSLVIQSHFVLFKYYNGMPALPLTYYVNTERIKVLSTLACATLQKCVSVTFKLFPLSATLTMNSISNQTTTQLQAVPSELNGGQAKSWHAVCCKLKFSRHLQVITSAVKLTNDSDSTCANPLS